MKRLEQEQISIRKAIRKIQDDGEDVAMDDFLAGLIADARKAAQDKLEAVEELTTLQKRQREWERVQEWLHTVEVWGRHIAQSDRDGALTYEVDTLTA